MAIELARIPLKRVHRITTREQAGLVHHRVPGMEGSLLQDLGRDAVSLTIDGIFYGATAAADIARLRSLHLKREPVELIADIVGQAYAGKVLLERFDVTQSAEDPGQYSYRLQVVEFVEPPRRAVGRGELDRQIALNAAAMLDLASLPDALSLGSLPEISNPFGPLSTALDPFREAAGEVNAALSGLRRILGD